MQSIEHKHTGPRQVGRLPRAIAEAVAMDAAAVRMVGIGLTERDARVMMSAAMDALEPTTFPATIGTPLQYLQNILPGLVEVVTQARKIDQLVGITNVGDWEDEEIIQGLLEYTGKSVPYGDYTNIPLASWNPGWERRTIVRFEEGLRVGKLEEARAAKGGINSAEQKRRAAALALDIRRNDVGFYGYNNGANRTYGFLNEPSLPPYVEVDTPFASGTFLQITAVIRSMLAALRTQSGDTIDPKTTPITIVFASDVVDQLTITSEFGNSVQDWLSTTYSNVRIESAPELNGANGGENVAYAYAENVPDSGTDDGRTWVQIVPTQFQLLGVENQAKALVEDYSNATAGVLLKRPFAVVRVSGL